MRTETKQNIRNKLSKSDENPVLMGNKHVNMSFWLDISPQMKVGGSDI